MSLKNLKYEIELIVVDDCSTDNTRDILSKSYSKSDKIKIIYNLKNMGKGFCVRKGIEYSSGNIILIQDADLEYNPEEYNLLLKPIIADIADVVYGSRFIEKQSSRTSYFWHSVANKFLTFLSNLFSNLKLTDMETCYKLFNTKMIQSITLTEKRFGFEPEITAKISRIKGIRVHEVGISYNSRPYDEGKKIGWKDGVRAIYCILKYGLFRMN